MDEVAATLASAIGALTFLPSSPSSSIFTNYPSFMLSLVSPLRNLPDSSHYVLPRGLKISEICRYKERRWDFKQLVGSGGMPSSHSATVTTLAATIGFQKGLGGPMFATALILACTVMYDSTGVRLQAGHQAEVAAGMSFGILTAVIGHLVTMIK